MSHSSDRRIKTGDDDNDDVRTVMYTLADGLEDFDVDGSCATIVAVIFHLLPSNDAPGALNRGKFESRTLRYA